MTLDILSDAALALGDAFGEILVPAAVFAALALVVKGRAAVAGGRRAVAESWTNLRMLCLDALLIAPPLALLVVTLGGAIEAAGLRLVGPETWSRLPPLWVALVAVFVADFIGYWRHRLEHTRWLWPSHALHHSDAEMTWLAIFRFHPINRLSTVLVDYTLLSMAGFPPAALVMAWAAKHYYGQFVHADLPWTLGPLRLLLVSPAMHRWHHADDPAAYGTNFATIFCVFDRAFGTYRVPGPCEAPLGVRGLKGKGLFAQLLHPFRAASYRRRKALRPASSGDGVAGGRLLDGDAGMVRPALGLAKPHHDDLDREQQHQPVLARHRPEAA